MKDSRTILFKVVLGGLSIVFTLFLAELFLRIIGKPNEYSGWKPNQVVAPEKNQLGYRGKRIEYTKEDLVVVLLGDSQVYAAGCSFSWLPEARLEHHLTRVLGRRVKVFSVAAEGWGTDQELLALQEYFQIYRADLVLLWFTPQNDLKNNVQLVDGQGVGKFKPTFWLENGKLQGPSHEWLMPVMLGGLRLGVLLDRAGLWPSLQKDWLKKHSEKREDAIALTQRLLKEIKMLSENQGARFIPFWAGTPKHLEEFSELSEQSLQSLKPIKLQVTLSEPFFGLLDLHFNEHAVDDIMQSLAEKIGP